MKKCHTFCLLALLLPIALSAMKIESLDVTNKNHQELSSILNNAFKNGKWHLLLFTDQFYQEDILQALEKDKKILQTTDHPDFKINYCLNSYNKENFQTIKQEMNNIIKEEIGKDATIITPSCLKRLFGLKTTKIYQAHLLILSQTTEEK